MRDVWRESAWVALLAFVSVCLVSTNIWENGDIEAKWWAVKAWADFQFPDIPPNHHNMRWGITFPAVLFVRLFGDGALSYHLLTHLVYALTTAGLYALTRMLTTPLTAALMFGLWLGNPIAYSLPTNLMPEIYSIVYPVAALLFLRNAYATGSRWAFAWAVVMMFFAYGAKETNIFFMPGWGLYELLRRRWSNVALMVGVFGGLVVVETLAVNLLLSDMNLWLGRAQAILQAGHLDEMSTDWIYQPIQLLTRWGFAAETKLDMVEWFSKAIYWAFFAVTGWKAWTWIRARSPLPPPGEIGPAVAQGGEVVSAAWAMGLSFAFCTTFFILKWQPLVLGQPLNDRYLWPLLVPAHVVLAVVLKTWFDHAARSKAAPLAVLARVQEAGASLMKGGRGWGALAAVAVLCTLARWPIEIGTIEVRRRGFDQPYTVFTAQAYFDQARSRLLDGCTLAFPQPRSAHALLVHALSFDEVSPTLQFYAVQLDGLTIDSRRLHGWSPTDYSVLAGKLYVPDAPSGDFHPFAMRLPGGQCTATFYYGHADIAPEDQTVTGRLSEPPARD